MKMNNRIKRPKSIRAFFVNAKMLMKYVILLFSLLWQIPLYGQSSNLSSRKSEIGRFVEKVYSLNDFKQISDLYQMSMDELCDYPIIFPIKKTTLISSGFGMRYHPIYKVWKFHTGIDIPKPMGTPVYASGNGTVIRKGDTVQVMETS